MRTDHRTPQCECLTRTGERCVLPGTWFQELPNGREVRICSTHIQRTRRGADLHFIPAPAAVIGTGNAQIPGRT
ncbi:hypothetical protein [Methylococcus mesophilus]|uniref:hypothetical protein n=1 Tax=Methylococcus mesophilus TaxID=2993564 RepID=UPI00224B8E37|nr:hypothetical protein [Methylococcus mesophilus]UZR30728.1 hypothetical protein OOT43_08910 [Methylococcus mesophilus]